MTDRALKFRLLRHFLNACKTAEAKAAARKSAGCTQKEIDKLRQEMKAADELNETRDRYAKVVWVLEDVLEYELLGDDPHAATALAGSVLSKEEALEVLQDAEDDIQERMTERGWDTLGSYIERAVKEKQDENDAEDASEDDENGEDES